MANAFSSFLLQFQFIFQVEFDVQDYRPEELSIKTEGDVLVVLAKHETKDADGGSSYVSKQFEQRFTLPSGVKPEQIASSLSKDGVLTISAPREAAKKTSIGEQEKKIFSFWKASAVIAHIMVNIYTAAEKCKKKFTFLLCVEKFTQ